MTERQPAPDTGLNAQGRALALQVDDLVVRYGGVTAVNGISLKVGSKDIVALLGANGAGKSSTLTALAGSSPGSVSGTIRLFGDKLGRSKAHRLTKRGVALVPEGRHVFAPLTVEDNLTLGAYRIKSRRRIDELMSDVYELFPILAERRKGYAGLLSGGEQQMLAFGRAMMSDPNLILMDEPSMGLAPIMVDRVMSAVRAINERGAAILIVEQNAVAALGVASFAYVLELGRVVHSGPATELSRDPAVARAFLGLREEPTIAAGQP